VEAGQRDADLADLALWTLTLPSIMDMNMAATKTTLTATFSLTRVVLRGLPDSG
jgi:hypothetical protein